MQRLNETSPRLVTSPNEAQPANGLQNPLHWWERLRPWRPRIMTQERAKAQGVFIPNWWLALLLIPLAGGVMWVVITLTTISANQTALKDTIEYRLKVVETQAKLNDEHARQLEIQIAKTQGAVEALARFKSEKKEEENGRSTLR